jgi:hypothetical protein
MVARLLHQSAERVTLAGTLLALRLETQCSNPFLAVVSPSVLGVALLSSGGDKPDACTLGGFGCYGKSRCIEHPKCHRDANHPSGLETGEATSVPNQFVRRGGVAVVLVLRHRLVLRSRYLGPQRLPSHCWPKSLVHLRMDGAQLGEKPAIHPSIQPMSGQHPAKVSWPPVGGWGTTWVRL